MYVIIWEFHINSESVPEFEEAYGPEGDWARLFTRAQEYLGTLLLRDVKEGHRYFTIDYWASREAYETFRDRWCDEHEAIDERCESRQSTKDT